MCSFIYCVQCSDCRSDLGGSQAGAEVRIRNQQLYCNVCYMRLKSRPDISAICAAPLHSSLSDFWCSVWLYFSLSSWAAHSHVISLYCSRSRRNQSQTRNYKCSRLMNIGGFHQPWLFSVLLFFFYFFLTEIPKVVYLNWSISNCLYKNNACTWIGAMHFETYTGLFFEHS